MKQRKSKHAEAKKIAILEEKRIPITISDATNKNFSGHTKTSTHQTIHSASPNISQAPHTPKNKSADTKNNRDNSIAIKGALPTSKSTKKLKINLNQNKNKVNEAQ